MNESDLAVELGDLATYLCPCCGRKSETVHGYLYDKAGATSVYFAGYTHGHPERRANMVLSVGGWGEGTTPEDRQAIALQAVSDGGRKSFTFLPVKASPWYGQAFLGIPVSPEQLSVDERILYIELARIAVEKDPRVAWYLEKG